MRYRFEQFELDWDNRALLHNGRTVGVEPKVLQFLHLMLESGGRLVTRDEINQVLWSNLCVGQNSLARIVKEARKAIRDSGVEPKLILTRRCHGYSFGGNVKVIATERVLRSEGRVASPNSVPPICTEDPHDTTTIEPSNVGGCICIEWALPRFRETTISRSGPTVLGRLASCNEVLDGSGVSRRHAQLAFQGPVGVVRDLGSHNGTYLNGQLVTVAPIVANDVLRIGGWLGTAHRHPPTATAGFRQLAPNYWGGPELAGLLQQASHDSVRKITLNIRGEPGVGKRAMARAIHQNLFGESAPLVLRCRRCEYLSADPRSLDGPWKILRASASRPCTTVILEDVDCLDAAGTERLAELLMTLDHRGVDLPSIVTTSTVSIADLNLAKSLPIRLASVLRGTELQIPPLRERRRDIWGLVTAFATQCNERPFNISAHAAEDLLLYSWPSNTAELKQTTRALAEIDAAEGQIGEQDLPSHFRQAVTASSWELQTSCQPRRIGTQLNELESDGGVPR